MIDVVNKIQENLKARGWSEYRLSEESDLTQSMISSWKSGGMSPSIASLSKVLDAFHISFSEFFLEDTEFTVTLTPIQKDILEQISRLTPEQQNSLLAFIKNI